MNRKKLKVLLIIEQCNPELASVPLVGYNYYKEISKIVDATLVTHERNQKALEKTKEHKSIIFIPESFFTKKYYPIVAGITSRGRINWPLNLTLTYPIYAEFNHKVYQQFKRQIQDKYYDLVHVITPMMPRYPAKVVKVCKNIPFLLGPVNGGVPFPSGFQEIAKQESAHYNFLRAIGRALIPGYVETYKKADRILAGSTYTLKMLQDLFDIPDSKISLFYENGITKDFLTESQKPKNNQDKLNLLFVGRLVPYKGADMLIEAVSKLGQNIQNKIQLTIVGDGSEKNYLQQRVKELNLDNIVTFTGWVRQQETIEYYRKSDIFCFPSIREFGGAVVLEAMACGLPCIVVNNGGIAEYVTKATGFTIEPISREFLIKELTSKIQLLIEDKNLRNELSTNSIKKAQEFEWGQKAKKMVDIYHEIIASKMNFINEEL